MMRGQNAVSECKVNRATSRTMVYRHLGHCARLLARSLDALFENARTRLGRGPRGGARCACHGKHSGLQMSQCSLYGNLHAL
jgi:hypothetical protein